MLLKSPATNMGMSALQQGDTAAQQALQQLERITPPARL
jgi:hypothetical protein